MSGEMSGEGGGSDLVELCDSGDHRVAVDLLGPRCSQDGAARCRLNGGHAAAVEHDEPVAMSSA